MHIAHSKGRFLRIERLVRLSGLKRRQIANLARVGEIPGARRSADGYHFEYPDTPELRVWIENKQRQVSRRLQPVDPYHSQLRTANTTAAAHEKNSADGRIPVKKDVLLACFAEVKKKFTMRCLPDLLRLSILREMEFKKAHPDLLKRYGLPTDTSIEGSIANWKLPRLLSFFLELVITDNGHIYDLERADTAFLDAFGVNYRTIQKRIKIKLNRERFRSRSD